MPRPSVSVTLVTFNSRRYIVRCLESLLEQTYRPAEVVIVDNASTDGTAALIQNFGGRIRVYGNEWNAGFARAQNQAIALTRGEWVLTLNPDVRLEPGFLEALVQAGEIDSRVGTVCGKLLRAGPDLAPTPEPRFDSAGIYFTPNLRHFDRGSDEPDDGRYSHPEYVFGASAAAALYRRTMIDNVSLEDGFFDPDFFAYREDADVAWRAQLCGWRCLYTPAAVAHHVRSVRPGSRRAVPALINMHSVKNRFLMRVKNLTPDLYRKHWLPILARDLLILGGCVFYEPASLPAFWHLARSLSRAVGKRRAIMSRAAGEDLTHWFSEQPAARPVAEPAFP
jgi:GT2 family glycosyltransferase